MKRDLERRLAAVLLATLLCGTATPAFAERRPIQRLPVDLVRWSMFWLIIPKAMAEVGRSEGPLAALTIGPAKGTVLLVRSTGEGLWKAMKPEKRPEGPRASQQNPKGPFLHYEF